MSKEKQIEEIGKILCNDLGCKHCERCFHLKKAENLYEQGYRKLPEDSVVLSREEYENSFDIKVYNKLREENRLLKKQNNQLLQDLIKERKETAGKILNKVNEFFRPFDKKSPIFLDLLLTKLENIVKQCCVETKE